MQTNRIPQLFPRFIKTFFLAAVIEAVKPQKRKLLAGILLKFFSQLNKQVIALVFSAGSMQLRTECDLNHDNKTQSLNC